VNFNGVSRFLAKNMQFLLFFPVFLVLLRKMSSKYIY